MGCCKTSCQRIYLFWINILFIIAGFVAFIGGLILFLNNDDFKTDKIRSLLNQLSVTEAIHVGDFLYGISIGIIVIGAFTIFTAALGWYGAKTGTQWCLFLYGVIVVFVMMGQLTTLILWGIMKGKITEDVHKQLSKALVDYDGVDSTDPVSNSWDLTFTGYECCGVNTVTEVENEFTTTKWWPNRLNSSDIVPASCCKGATEANYKNQDPACQQSLTTIYEEGCYDSLKSWLVGFINTFLTCLIFVSIFEGFSIMCTYGLFQKSRKSDLDKEKIRYFLPKLKTT